MTATAQITPVDAFIARWHAAGGSERANYQLFLTELAALLELPTPDPAADDTRDNAYVFERRVSFRHGDGSESLGFIDLYRRGAFVLEAKRVKQNAGKGFDDALLRARGQAEQYARALPADEGRPPFLVVADVGNVIELYAEFSRSGATYTPFPDPRSHRIRLEELREEAVRERLKAVWLDPLSLDPARRAARVTRAIATQLAVIAKSLEAAGHDPERVAGFLTRCLFTFFAEDVGLLPKRAFIDLLESLKDQPAQFVPLVGELWRAMDVGEFSVAIRSKSLRFNGKLFKNPDVLSLDRDQISLLIDAARADWRHVEPAIIGTLLERALDPVERHRLGAHYTPRAYVERLVLPTVIEPLRQDWKDAQAAALTLAAEGDLKGALAQVRAFHHQLCELRVLDPACGSGNFLYVTLEHLKRLEGEVLNQLEELGDTQGLLDLAGVTVDPHQFFGIELNPRAAALAELVLWIGYLQWHFRTRGQIMPPEPVLKDFRNIECRDAVLTYDRIEYVSDENGIPVTRWDGKTMKASPVTGEPVPDVSARLPLERYVNARKAAWPEADFVVGNPPFIGNKRMRTALGDEYVQALRSVWPEVPESADFVMYWWHEAADLTRSGKLRKFGLITTNSLRQTFNRRLLEHHMAAKPPLSLVFAIPDHPWVDSADGAAVRIAMTVGQQGELPGREHAITCESEGGDDGAVVVFSSRVGKLQADLSAGAAVSSALPLQANLRMCWQGCKLVGSHFQVSPVQAGKLLEAHPGSESRLRRYWAGGDINKIRNERFVIDTHGLTEGELRQEYPAAYQHLNDYVRPERMQNRDKTFRERWWLFGRSRPDLRAALDGLTRYIVTSEVGKHRFFVFLDWPENLVDGSVIAITLSDALDLGVLSSYPHTAWALAAGGRMGVGNDPRYQNGPCFDPFPFPAAEEPQQSRIRELAEQLDAHRKRQQAAHPALTLTGMYNVMEKLKAGEPLTDKERALHEQGLVSVLKQLHDELDLAVLEAYGWSDLAPLMEAVNGKVAAETGRDDSRRALDDSLLERLVALNTERAAEERRGIIRWLRPALQNPAGQTAAPAAREIETEQVAAVAAAAKRPWPKDIAGQVKELHGVLVAAAVPLSVDKLADYFSGRGPWKKRLPQLVEMLIAVGRARRVGEAGVAAVS